MEVDVRTDEVARVEWGVILNADVLTNCSTQIGACPEGRTEFDAVIDAGEVSFASAADKAERCVETMPTDVTVCIAACSCVWRWHHLHPETNCACSWLYHGIATARASCNKGI